MSEKKVGKRLLTWVLVLVMTLSLLPLNVLAANPAVMRIVRPDTDKYITYNFYLNEGDKTPYYSQIIKNNESLDAPATPEKKDYKFVGWYDGDEQFSNFGTAITVTEGSTDVDLYAKFVPVCYVYFMDGTGEGARIIATKEVTATDPLNDFSDVAFPIGADEAITGNGVSILISDAITGSGSGITVMKLVFSTSQGFYIVVSSFAATASFRPVEISTT